jgi:hypothetical protein
MSSPRVRFTLGQLMVAVAASALGLALVRVHPALGTVYFLAVLGVPVLTNAEDGLPRRRLRPDVRGVALCYLAGVVGPAVCLVLDPVVFQGGYDGRPILHSVRAFCYAFMGIEMALFTAWLWLGDAFRPAAHLVAGALRVGALFAVCVGLMLLPLSVFGLLLVIGALGFTPFLTAYAYLVQGGRAARLSGQTTMGVRALALELVGAALAVGPPVVVQMVAGQNLL